MADTSPEQADIAEPSESARRRRKEHRRGLKRSSAACQRCRRRKQKCDAKHPVCTPCAQANAECIPSERLVIRVDPDCECDDLRSRVGYLQEQVDQLQLQLQQQGQSYSLFRRSGAADDGGNEGDQYFQPPPPPPPQRGHFTVGSVATQRRSYWGRILLPTFPQRATPSATSVMSGPRSSRTSARVHGEQDLSFLSSPWHLWGGISPNSDPVDSTDSRNTSTTLSSPWAVPFELYAPELVDAFFARRWPQLPVLHRRTFTRLRYEVYSDFVKRSGTSQRDPTASGMRREGEQETSLGGQDGLEEESDGEDQEADEALGLAQFQTNIVLAIGCVEKPRVSSGHSFSHHDFFNLAVACLPAVLNTPDDVVCLQCLLLLCMYGINEPQSVNLWYTAGLALRLAAGVDLHRKESVASGVSLLEAEMAKRLFWSVYTLDRSLSIAMGRPLGIPDGDITMPLPLCISDDLLESAVGAAGAESLQNMLPQVDDTSTFIHVIKLRRLNTDIYNALHAAGAGTAFTVSAAAETTPFSGLLQQNQQAAGPSEDSLSSIRQRYFVRLNQWLVTAPRYPAQTSMFQSNEWFQIAYHQAVINLHRPSHASLSSSPSSSASDPSIMSLHSIRLCADASISLISAYGALYAKNRVSYTFIALNSLFLAAVTMLYSLRASATLRTELTRDVAEYNVRSCATLIEDIAAGREVGQRCANIVRRLGEATMSYFRVQGHFSHHPSQVDDDDEDDDIDTEFLQWFGLRGRRPRRRDPTETAEQQQELTTPSVDVPWYDLFDNGFDLNAFVCPELCV